MQRAHTRWQSPVVTVGCVVVCGVLVCVNCSKVLPHLIHPPVLFLRNVAHKLICLLACLASYCATRGGGGGFVGMGNTQSLMEFTYIVTLFLCYTQRVH